MTTSESSKGRKTRTRDMIRIISRAGGPSRLVPRSKDRESLCSTLLDAPGAARDALSGGDVLCHANCGNLLPRQRCVNSHLILADGWGAERSRARTFTDSPTLDSVNARLQLADARFHLS